MSEIEIASFSFAPRAAFRQAAGQGRLAISRYDQSGWEQPQG